MFRTCFPLVTGAGCQLKINRGPRKFRGFDLFSLKAPAKWASSQHQCEASGRTTRFGGAHLASGGPTKDPSGRALEGQSHAGFSGAAW